MKTTPCNGTHRAGDGVSYLVYDINRIPFARVCDVCRNGRGEKAYDKEAVITQYAHLNLWQAA